MARTEILAAGGIVVRGGRVPLIAVVQRRKDDWWVLPKGKLKRDESMVAAAKREAVEETGVDISVQEFLGAVSYEVGSGSKLVQFWRMQMIEGPERKLMDDIKAVEWLPLREAIERLDHPVEQAFLRGIGNRVVAQQAHAPRRRSGARKVLSRKKIATVKVAARKRPAARAEKTVLPAPQVAATETGSSDSMTEAFETLKGLELTVVEHAGGEPLETGALVDVPVEARPSLMLRLMRRIAGGRAAC